MAVEVTGHAGLHARQATAFASLAKDFEAEVLVGHWGTLANDKSMAALLTQGAERRAARCSPAPTSTG